jgi:hypothetical protein
MENKKYMEKEWGKQRGRGRTTQQGDFMSPSPHINKPILFIKKKPILCLGYLHPYQIDSPTKHYLREFS